MLDHSTGDGSVSVSLDERETSRNLFLESHYLREPYVVLPEIEALLVETAADLKRKFPEFVCLTVVGGLANGSYALRRAENRTAATDIDFYLIGHTTTQERLSEMADFVGLKFKQIGITPDPTLNGKKLHYYLNLDALDRTIGSEDFNFLALPFGASYGDIDMAKRIVLDAVLSRDEDEAQRIWDEIREYHIQSLSLHHGTWPAELSTKIFNDYYPRKIEKFQLPLSPAEAQEKLGPGEHEE